MHQCPGGRGLAFLPISSDEIRNKENVKKYEEHIKKAKIKKMNKLQLG